MKRKIFLILLCQLLAAGVFAQSIKTQKTLLAPKETGVYHANQVAALNTKTGQTLVVWQRVASPQSIILGRLVNAQGNAATGQVQLSITEGVAHPAVAYNPARNEFMVAYDDNPGVQALQTNIYVRRLSAQGNPIAGEVKISTDTISAEMANLYPKLAFNPGTGGYDAVWLREINSSAQAGNGNNGVVGMALTSSGAPSGPVVLVQSSLIERPNLYSPTILDVMIHPASGKLLIVSVLVLASTGGRQANYYLATVDPGFNGVTSSNLAKINKAPLQLNTGFIWGARLALFTATPGFVFFSDSGNVKRRKIDLLGKLAGVPVVAFKPPKTNTLLVYPAVAFITNAKGTRGLLIATQDAFSSSGTASTWAQVLDSKGLPLGPPVLVDVTSSTDTALGTILTPLPPKASDKLFRFVSYYTLAQFTSPGQTYQNSGIVKLNLNVTVP